MPSASEARGAAAVVFDGVWKKFRTGETHDSLRDLLPAILRRAGMRAGMRATAGDATDDATDDATRGAALGTREFWAVRDVSFHVGPGEVLGIIGANGAGKSTLLKLLTRVLRPTHGQVAVRGRIGALIEVAAGFHPDLTGRENVFLQGAILGMRTRETARKFDEIVAFAGVEGFIDTPVKRYSSGMNARLGFAIAAHLEPDVLVVDEVLSVGDFAFQVKAFERLAALARGGIPVVVVSHQLDRVVSLCTRALVLDRGIMAHEGRPADCVAWYTARASHAASIEDPAAPVFLRSITLGASEVASGGQLAFRVEGEVRDRAGLESVEAVGLRLRSTGSGEVVSRTSSARCGVAIAATGPFAVEGELQLNVPAGVYLIEVHPWDNARQRTSQQSLAATITVREGASFSGAVQLNARMRRGAPESR